LNGDNNLTFCIFCCVLRLYGEMKIFTHVRAQKHCTVWIDHCEEWLRAWSNRLRPLNNLKLLINDRNLLKFSLTFKMHLRAFNSVQCERLMSLRIWSTHLLPGRRDGDASYYLGSLEACCQSWSPRSDPTALAGARWQQQQQQFCTIMILSIYYLYLPLFVMNKDFPKRLRGSVDVCAGTKDLLAFFIITSLAGTNWGMDNESSQTVPCRQSTYIVIAAVVG